MKKNTFKKPTITYEPIEQPRKPYWMWHVEHSKSSTGLGDFAKTIALLVGMAVVAVVLILLTGGR